MREGQILPVNDRIIKYCSARVWMAEYIRLAKRGKPVCDLITKPAIRRQNKQRARKTIKVTLTRSSSESLLVI